MKIRTTSLVLWMKVAGAKALVDGVRGSPDRSQDDTRMAAFTEIHRLIQGCCLWGRSPLPVLRNVLPEFTWRFGPSDLQVMSGSEYKSWLATMLRSSDFLWPVQDYWWDTGRSEWVLARKEGRSPGSLCRGIIADIGWRWRFNEMSDGNLYDKADMDTSPMQKLILSALLRRNLITGNSLPEWAERVLK